MAKEIKKFPAVDVEDLGDIRVSSHNVDVEICYNLIVRVAKALPKEEGDVLRSRLQGAKSNEALAGLAVEVAENTGLVDRALAISDEEWANVQRGCTKDKVREEMRLVLKLVEEK